MRGRANISSARTTRTEGRLQRQTLWRSLRQWSERPPSYLKVWKFTQASKTSFVTVCASPPKPAPNRL